MECLRSLSPLTSNTSRLIIGIPQLILSIASLIANLLLLLTLLHSSPLHFSFQLHVVSLIIASLGFIAIALFVFTPIVLFAVEIDDPLLIILSTPDSLFYQAMMFITTLIAVERCSLFLSPSFHQFLSTGPVQYVFILLPWFAAIFIVSHSTYTGCYKRVDPFGLRYTYSCSNCGVYSDLLFYASFAFPIIIAVSYGTLFVFLYIQNARSQEANITVLSNRQQVSFAVQFTIIAILQLFGSSFFYILPRLFGSSDSVNSLLTSFSTLNSMANPICMFLFQHSIRDAFCDLPLINQCCKKRTLPFELRSTTRFRFSFAIS